MIVVVISIILDPPSTFVFLPEIATMRYQKPLFKGTRRVLDSSNNDSIPRGVVVKGLGSRV